MAPSPRVLQKETKSWKTREQSSWPYFLQYPGRSRWVDDASLLLGSGGAGGAGGNSFGPGGNGGHGGNSGLIIGNAGNGGNAGPGTPEGTPGTGGTGSLLLLGAPGNNGMT